MTDATDRHAPGVDKGRGDGCCTVLELRQYTLHPGSRDTLVDLFDAQFIEPQEAVGAHVVGQFRDQDRADTFVWLRGFADMSVRHSALSAFYGGRAWVQHRDAANATMIDSDNVLLLRPAWQGSGLTHPRPQRPADGADLPDTEWHICVYRADRPVTASVLEQLQARVSPADGDARLAWYTTETATNTFTGLPVRDNEHVIVSVGSAPVGLGPSTSLAGIAVDRVQAMRLQPTSRSQLR